MNGYREMLNNGASRRQEAAALALQDLDDLKPPDDELAAIAYWDSMRDMLADSVQEAVAEARKAGRSWAEIAGALNTSTESARGRHHYYKGRS